MFQGIRFDYSKFTWRATALSGDTVDGDNFDEEADFHSLHFDYTGNTLHHKRIVYPSLASTGLSPGVADASLYVPQTLSA